MKASEIKSESAFEGRDGKQRWVYTVTSYKTVEWAPWKAVAPRLCVSVSELRSCTLAAFARWAVREVTT